MCSRTVSDPANRLRKTRKKNSSAVPLFSKRSHIGNLRRIRKQGKGRSSKRKGNRRCPFLFAPAAGAAVSRAPQSATSRPLGANTLAQFVYPAKSVQKRLPPRQSVSLTRLVCSGHPVQKRRRPDRLNRLRGSSAPVNQRKIMDSCRCSTNTTCRSTPNLLQ